MKVENIRDLSGDEALNLARQGHVLSCPVCSATLKSLPEVEDKTLTMGLICPVSQSHFFVLGENESAMKEMRARMKARAER